ncbi:MAG: hypothetical protein ACP5T0_04475 [Verrucomicrobiia bacterium]
MECERQRRRPATRDYRTIKMPVDMRWRISYGVRAAKLRSNCDAAMWMLKETNLEMKYQIN